MAFPKKLSELCTPSLVYFVFSMVVFVIMLVQNLGNSNSYSLGNLSVSVPNTTIIFIVKLIYILFWTWILNLICKDGYKSIAWFLVLLPFILLLMIMFMMSMYK